MPRILRHHPSPAMVVACISLAVALGGTSYAAVKLPPNSVGTKQLKANAVTSIKVRNNALTGVDIREAKLGRVPSATNADLLDGVDSTGFVEPGSSEAWHEVGAANQPPFLNNWVNAAPTISTTAAFYRDPLDVIHLKGIVDGGSGGQSVIFILPEGYRPNTQPCLVTARGNATPGPVTPVLVCVGADGSVVVTEPFATTGQLFLDGLNFRLGS